MGLDFRASHRRQFAPLSDPSGPGKATDCARYPYRLQIQGADPGIAGDQLSDRRRSVKRQPNGPAIIAGKSAKEPGSSTGIVGVFVRENAGNSS